MMTDEIGWREVGWGMVLGGAVLLVISLLLDATPLVGASAAIALGGLVAVVYAATGRSGDH